jgi:hypothetical protein
VRKIVRTIAGLWLCGLLAAAGADSFPLADGTTVGGDIVSFNDNGIIFRSGDDKYTDRLPWVKFSQDGLKQLAQNPKIDPFVAPFILPAAPEQARKPEVKVGDMEKFRLDRSAPASLFGGLFSSGVGLLALLLIYAANIFAGYEIALFRARPAAVVMGAAAVLPFVGPVIFLSLPGLRPAAAEEETRAEMSAETPADGAPAANAPHRFTVPGVQAEEEIHIVAGSWQTGTSAAPPPSPAEPEPEIFQRGQFMFNRRFFETKFAGFFGIVRREGDKNKVLLVKTPRGLIVAERITRITANDAHFEVMRGDSRQEVMVPFAEIQEVQLKHKGA